jgi:hypothetical protein
MEDALWVLILPIIAILVGGFSEWLKFREKQVKLGASTKDLEHTVAEQQKALDTATRRIQNLEAIVTSQLWDDVHDETMPEVEQRRARTQALLPLDEPDDDAERVARMARRLTR